MRRFDRPLRALGAGAVLVLSLSAALPARAEEAKTDECPTWFPDFRCDRHGRFDGFVAPVTMPYLFEDPFITTGATAWYIWHQFPGNSVFQGGTANILALQLRVAITDKLAFIATKDGYTFLNPDLPMLHNTQGWMNLAGGFKYQLVSDREHQVAITPIFRIEAPTGGSPVLQGEGSWLFLPSIAFAKGWDKLHLMGNLGWEIPSNGKKNSNFTFLNGHLDYAVHEHFVPFIESNWLHYMNGGDGVQTVHTKIGNVPISTATSALGIPGFDAVDYGNIGGVDLSNTDIVTMGWGFRIPINRHLSVATAYEIPLTPNKDIFEQRWTTKVLLEF